MASEYDAEPVITLCLECNAEWYAVLSGWLQLLAEDESWEGSVADVSNSLDQVARIAEAWDLQGVCMPVMYPDSAYVPIRSGVALLGELIDIAYGTSQNEFLVAYQPQPHNGDAARWRFYMQATEIAVLALRGVSGPNHGIIELLIDGVLAGTIDMYDPNTVWNQSWSFGPLTLEADGMHDLLLRVVGKNPASISYFWWLSDIRLT